MTIFYVETVASNANAHADNSGCTETAAITGSAATLAGSVLSLDGSPNLSALVIAAGDTQSTIWLSQATNTSRKIFKITAFDDTANTVTVDVAPTGITSSAWRIGGPIIWPSGTTIYHSEDMLMPGDILQFNNSPATRTAGFYNPKRSGTNAGGYIKIRGKAGVRPVWQITSGASNVLNGSGNSKLIYENLEFVQSATGNAINTFSGSFVTFDNIKISDATAGIVTSPCSLMRSEITNVATQAIYMGTAISITVIGCYIHDIGDIGIFNATADPTCFVLHSIFDTFGAGGRAIYFSASTSTGIRNSTIIGNTFYNIAEAGIEMSDLDHTVFMYNNIFSECGQGASKYTLKWPASTTIEQAGGYHFNNIYYNSGSGPQGPGGVNFQTPPCLTLDATELTTDPLFVDAAGGNFSLQSGSPAKGAGYPGTFLGGGSSVGYMDIGAVQRQEPVGGSGGGAYVIGG